MFTLAKPLTSPISLLNSTTISTAPAPSQSVTLLHSSSNMMDYHIRGTSLVLRITETGSKFTRFDLNLIIDKAIYSVVRSINTGHGKEYIAGGKFWTLTQDMDIDIKAFRDAGFTYFVLGKQIRCRRRLLFRLHSFLFCKGNRRVTLLCSQISSSIFVEEVLNLRRRCPCRNLAVYE